MAIVYGVTAGTISWQPGSLKRGWELSGPCGRRDEEGLRRINKLVSSIHVRRGTMAPRAVLDRRRPAPTTEEVLVCVLANRPSPPEPPPEHRAPVLSGASSQTQATRTARELRSTPRERM